MKAREQLTMRDHQPCGRSGCSEPGVATFGAKTLCSDHFLVACYEVLERLDRGMGLSARAATEAREAKRVADECARGVLEVSLNAAELSNLQKARLLDVLLWAGDIPGGNSAVIRASGSRHVETVSSDAGAVTQSSKKLTGAW
jgi:hypothetical protein